MTELGGEKPETPNVEPSELASASASAGADVTDTLSPTLHERIAQLEAENAQLKDAVAASTAASTGSGDSRGSRRGAVLPAGGRARRSWGWTLLATVLIVIGSVLAPVAVIASTAKAGLTDTDRFVGIYAPLAEVPAVQNYVTDQVVDVINERVDIEQITSDVIDSITSLGTGPRATQALDALKGPAAQALQSLVRTKVGEFVASDAFADVWERALRLSHTQLVAAMRNDPDATLVFGPDGSIGIQIASIVAEVRTWLIDQGISFASRIPEVDRVIVIAQSDSVPLIQLGYGVAVAAGLWLPWVVLLILAAGVLVARRKSVALVWAAVGLALSMTVLVAGFAIGRAVFIASLSPTVLPSDFASVIYGTVTRGMRDTSVAVLVLAIVVAVVAWASSPLRVPGVLRAWYAGGVARIRAQAERRGITTGRFGEWMHAQRVLTRAAVAVIGVAVLLLLRPLTPPVILWTLLGAALAIMVLSLVERPDAVADARADAIPDADAEGSAPAL